MGYDAPELSNVASIAAARRGGRLLTSDLRAFQAGRVAPPHLTVVGDSYGSTTAGSALSRRSSGVDELVLVGSPGIGVERARELRVPSRHVFVGASSRDPVSYLDWFGPDPAHERFGAIRFRAESATRNPWLLDLDDHTRYFDPGSESLSNVSRIVVGEHDVVRVADYRREAWLLPDGIGTDPEADRVPSGRR
jgi:pimeloyl-ACP methyl ester carboxylesterase